MSFKKPEVKRQPKNTFEMIDYCRKMLDDDTIIPKERNSTSDCISSKVDNQLIFSNLNFIYNDNRKTGTEFQKKVLKDFL